MLNKQAIRKTYKPKEVFEEAKVTFDLFTQKVTGKKHCIQFTDRSELNFSFHNRYLAHALGFNIDDIFSELVKRGYFIDEPTQSYEIVKYLLNNMDVMLYLYRSKGEKLFNLEKISIKAKALKSFFELENMNFGKIQITDNQLYDKSYLDIINYLFVVDGDHINLLGFGRDLNDNYNCIKTVLTPKSIEKYFINQDVVLPTRMKLFYKDIRTNHYNTYENRTIIKNKYRYLLELRKNIIASYEKDKSEKSLNMKLIKR